MSGANSPTSPTCGWVLLPEFKTPSTPLSTPSKSTKSRKSMCLHTQTLSQNWEWKEHSRDQNMGSEGWTKTSVPTEIFKDLLDAGKIKDPFVDRNEEEVQWVGERDWIYRTTFSVERGIKEGEKVALVFEGLDTFADVYLNEKLILQSENMFHEHRVEVTEEIKDQNILTLVFYSALNKGRELVKERGELKFWNGEASRLYVRKAQYHWGWDWGPTIMSCGPWRPIHLETYKSRISNLHFPVRLSEDLKSATVSYMITLDSVPADPTIRVALYNPQKKSSEPLLKDKTTLVYSETVPAESVVKGTFTVENPKLWYPYQYGSQPLYQLVVDLYQDDTLLDTQSKPLAFRKAHIIQKPLDNPHNDDHLKGTTFFVEVNNIPIFCAGANWIPADNILTRILPSRYRSYLLLLQRCGMSMLRIWGGGIYEHPTLYSLADEMGILIWQDFMFACGQYPAHPEFLSSVRKEVECVLERLKWHPSIVVYAGNNEDYQVAEAEGLQWDPKEGDEEKWLKGTFPARYIYEKVLPEAVERYVGEAASYHPGSPWGGEGANDTKVGDIHQWSVWHGSQLPYQSYPSLYGRFVSEFGMQSLPHTRALHKFITSPLERYSQSRTMDSHNKATGFERRLGAYILENYRLKGFSLEEYSLVSQRMQADALARAFGGWRRLWKGRGREECGGTLVWQLNDCWGCTSWSIIDYYLRPKLSYYSIRRELRPINISIERTLFPKSDYLTLHNEGYESDPEIENEEVMWLDIWGVNSTLEEVDFEFRVECYDIRTGEKVDEVIDNGGRIPENGSQQVATFNLSTRVPNIDPSNIVVSVAFRPYKWPPHNLGKPDGMLRSAGDWPQPLKYIDFRERGVKYVVEGEEVTLSAKLPTKSVVLDVEGADDSDLKWSDNGFDIMPGETVKIQAKGLNGRKVTVSWYGDSS